MKEVKKGYSGRKVSNSETFREKAVWQHGNRYDYSSVEYVNSTTRVKIICEQHGPFWQLPNDHTGKAAGCPKCKNEATGERCKTGTEAFIEKAVQIFGDYYDYSLVEYLSTRKPVTIICPRHGEFRKLPCLHINRESGCFECHLERIRKPKEKKVNYFDQFNTEYFIQKSREIHGNKYDYSKSEYVNNSTKVIITCKDHGDFEQKPNTHTNGSGCKDCRRIKLRKLYQKSKEEFEEESIIIHGNKYDYSNVVYVSNKHKVEIVCPDHGSFWQKPNNHLYAEYGCPTCAEKEANGWSRCNGFYQSDKPSNLYFIEMYSEEEHFLKIGLSKDLERRHATITTESGYKIIPILSKEGVAKDLFEIEFSILNEKGFKKYRPLIMFGGISECFNINQKQPIINYIEEVTNV